MYRTHHCNQLRKADIGQTVTLAGWVNTNRDHHGVIFIDLRDREGVTQVVFRPEENPEVAAASHKLRGEDVIQISGRVAARLPGTENAKLATGEIEIVATQLHVLNKAEVPPFPLDDTSVNEDLRMQYRYLDLRTTHMQRNLKLRHRDRQSDARLSRRSRFLEIETPILSNPTPEGARDFLVPSPAEPGGVLRAAAGAAAIQATPAGRRAPRSISRSHAAFAMKICARIASRNSRRSMSRRRSSRRRKSRRSSKGLLARIFREARGVEIPTPFPRMTYAEAMNRYGSDKPDTRFGLELVDIADVFRDSQFKVFRSVRDGGGIIKAINAKGAASLLLSKEQLKKWEEWVKIEFGAKGLAYIKWSAGGEWESPIVKFFSETEKAALAERWTSPRATCSSSART